MSCKWIKRWRQMLNARGEPPGKRVRRETLTMQKRLCTLCLRRRNEVVTMEVFLKGVGHNVRLIELIEDASDDVTLNETGSMETTPATQSATQSEVSGRPAPGPRRRAPRAATVNQKPTETAPATQPEVNGRPEQSGAVTPSRYPCPVCRNSGADTLLTPCWHCPCIICIKHVGTAGDWQKAQVPCLSQ